MRLKTKLVAGATAAIVTGAASPFVAEYNHQQDLAFRYRLEPDMHDVLVNGGTLDTSRYSIDTDSLFVDAGTPMEATNKLIANEGYTTKEPASDQAFALAACAVSAATADVPKEAADKYKASAFVDASSACLSGLVTAINNKQIDEVKAPEGLPSPE